MDLLLTRLLWIRRSKWQFLIAGTAFLAGLALMLTTWVLYGRFGEYLGDQREKGQFLILNKKIGMVNTLGLASSSFTLEEVREMRKNPAFQKIGYIQANQFKAAIRARNYINFYTMAFFESVTPGFLDVPDADFSWKPGQIEVPIVVSQDFLNLYNFGFALSQGLPQVSRDALKLVSFDVEIEGPKGRQVFTGQIVGFSERISSVLVPQSFLEWGNREIAGVPSAAPSRVIVKVASASDPGVVSFLEKNRLVTDQERLRLGKTGSVLYTLMQGIGLLGLAFVGLALVMFTLQFRLVLAEASAEIRLLIELGFRHLRIGLNLLGYFAFFLTLLFGLCLLAVSYALNYSLDFLHQQGLDLGAASLAQAFWPGLAFCLLVLGLNGILIVNQLRRIA